MIERDFDTKSREVEKAIVREPVVVAYAPPPPLVPYRGLTLVTPPYVFRKAITRPYVETAVGVGIKEEKSSAILVNEMLQKLQARNTKLEADEDPRRSPDIRTGVIGTVSKLSTPYPYGKVRILPGIPQKPPPAIYKDKEAEIKQGKLNILDKFFLWINAILK